MFFGYGYYKSTINYSKIIPKKGGEINKLNISNFYFLFIIRGGLNTSRL